MPQAEALDRMLDDKGLRLDGVVALEVDPDILVRRIASRVEEMKARGEPLRADDNPEVLKQRLTAYQAQTAPLVDYYRGKGALRAVDGMASISDVAAAIGRALADAAFRPVPARKAAVRRESGLQKGCGGQETAVPRLRLAGRRNRPRQAQKGGAEGGRAAPQARRQGRLAPRRPRRRKRAEKPRVRGG